MERPILVFDIVETILDLRALSPVFENIFGDAAMLRTWFDEVVLYAQALTLTGAYVDVGRVGAAALKMLANIHGRVVDAAQLAQFKKISLALPAYADVRDGLETLQRAGFRMVTLSNNPGATCETQLTSAGIRPFFERVFSIDDTVHRYKPAREAYLEVATALNRRPGDLWLITCHAFDAMGALAAGLNAGLLLRPGNAQFEIGAQPDLVHTDLRTMADALVARFPAH